MAAALVHRGPDGEGFWSDGTAFLGHRRLAVIDLVAGDQPMAGDRGAMVVLNGEIYNYRELRRALEGAGVAFRTTSDTEVLVKAYETWGEACLDRLVGMFAFAIWDAPRRRLFLARDRLGKKPLFWFEGGGIFAFASEIKALLVLEAVRARCEVDPLAVSDFLSLGYILSPKTVFRTIRRLPAGHCATFDMAGGGFVVREYWRLDAHVCAPPVPYDRRARTRFTELFEDAVRLRLRADVPLGVLLSGGVDSAAVTAEMARLVRERPRGFCVRFAEQSFDESAEARRVAAHLGADLTVIDHEAPDAGALVRLVRQVDEPFADTSIVPTFLLDRAARAHTTVALSGDGGDEVLAGYTTYLADRLYAGWRLAPGALRRFAEGAAQALLRPSYRKVSLDYMARQFLAADGLSRERAHYRWRVVFSEEEKRRLMGTDLAAACRGYDPFDVFNEHFARVRGASFLRRTQYVDIKTWLEGDILVKVDRMSMASALEVRCPFLDHRLVEFCLSLADSAKMSWMRRKVMLRDIMADRLPRRTLVRRKRGFNAPVAWDGAIRFEDPARTGLFADGFVLDPVREDVTFKCFALAALRAWLVLYAGLRDTGRWETAAS